MSHIHLEILRAAKAKDICLGFTNEKESDAIWQLLIDSFHISLDGQIWCQIKFDHDEFNPEGWKKISTLFEKWPIFLFCDHYRNPIIYKIDSASDMQNLIGECFAFVFYVVSADFKKLAAYDDHQCLRFVDV